MSTRRVLAKKGKVILIVSIVFGVIFIGASGYLLWRINQEEKLSSEESGAVACIAGDQCPACEWPDVSYCGCPDDTTPPSRTCGCRRPGNFNCGPACGTITKCTPPSCPLGWESCGVSGDGSAEGEGCVAKTSCNTACSICNNKAVVKRYCRKVNVCDGGGWTKQVPATVEYGQSVEISGYGKDSDGVPVNSVVVKLDGTSVGNGNAKVDSSDSTKTNWSKIFTDLAVGDHTITISWKDTEGATSSDCELSATFIVNEENVCDGGGWTTQVPSTVEKGESVNISGYGKDSDGVDPTSVEILVDGESVGNGNATVSTLDTTKTKWSYTISGLEEGNIQ